jgi:ADP-ribose pyrophosphatase
MGSALWRLESSRIGYSSPFVEVHDDELILPDSSHIRFSRLSLSDFVTVLPVLSEKVIFVKNYRYPANNIFLELPSGIIEEGETPEACARRELEEETGYKGTPTYITWYYPSDRSMQKAFIYYAEITGKGDTNRDETEFQEVELLPIETVLKMFLEDTFKHAPTLIALGLCQTILSQKIGIRSSHRLP